MIYNAMYHSFMLKTVKNAVYKGLKANSSDCSLHPCVSYNNIIKTLYLQRMLAHVQDIPGDVVECGVGKGESLLIFTSLLQATGSKKHVWGFDSFEGFPEPSKEDDSIRNPKKGEWSDTSLTGVLGMLREAGFSPLDLRKNVTLVQGFFNESLSKYRGDTIALLHVDVDLYQSYIDVLSALYPKVIKGGVVMFDEYMSTGDQLRFPGAQKAIDEYFGDRVSWIQRDEGMGKYYLIKQED
ncbi:MAG: hypothetical protein HOJ16_09105 [Candidatus Peribacter sp.]|nr:hypothetical protein [Candidatus Peribacter sp.]